MYYFDNQFLQSYLDLVPSITVYVKGQPLTISSKSDLGDTQVGVGYDEYGKPISFPYPQVQQVLAKGQRINLDQLQKAIKGKEKPKSQEEKPPQEPSGEEKPSGGEPKGGGGGKQAKPEEPSGGEEGEEKTTNIDQPNPDAPEKSSEKPSKEKEPSKKESVIRLHHFISIDNPRSPQHGLTGVVRHKDSYGIVIEAYNGSSAWTAGDMVTVKNEYL